MVQSKVKSMSKSRYDWRPVNQYVLVPSPLGIKGVPSEKFSSTSGGVHWSEIVGVAIGRAAWEACSATWNLGTNSAFALGPRKTMENLDRIGRSQDLPDANWLLASSPALNTRALTLVPICALYVITPVEGINVYRHKYAYNYTYICNCDSMISGKFGSSLYFV
jgi:hypothetical protein